MKATDEETKASLAQELLKKEKETKYIWREAKSFIQSKETFARNLEKNEEVEAITVDFQENLLTPNITTSDVYYRRQLNLIFLNIHALSDSTSVFYTYDESVARKGADDVCSMLKHFFENILSPTVKYLILF